MGSKVIQMDPMAVASDVLEQLPQGAFLTVKSKHHLNTMTIGWASVGVFWSRPVLVAAVRTSRYTFKLIEQAPDFTVSVPKAGEYREELAICGTKSGKNTDKFAECGLKTLDAQETDTPLLDMPGIHFECKTLLRSPISPELMHPDLQQFYGDNDYHTFYFGDIVACTKRT